MIKQGKVFQDTGGGVGALGCDKLEAAARKLLHSAESRGARTSTSQQATPRGLGSAGSRRASDNKPWSRLPSAGVCGVRVHV